jgi:hypothetical protein
MSAPISFPIWLLLVAMIGTPLHLFLRQRHLQTRFNYAALSAFTLAVTMLIGFTVPTTRHSFNDIISYVDLSLSFGVVFGVPVGLIFRGIILEDR